MGSIYGYKSVSILYLYDYTVRRYLYPWIKLSSLSSTGGDNKIYIKAKYGVEVLVKEGC
jgi:hypothetical protein